jgi:glucose-6-phosphate-specific signal transduction histidine kinase
MALFPAKRLLNLQTLLVCALLVSLAWTVYDVFGVTLSIWILGGQPKGHSVVINGFVWPYMFLKQYLAILLVVPWVLMAKMEFVHGVPLRQRMRNVAAHLLAWDMLILAACALLFTYWIATHNADWARRVSLMAVLFPIVWMIFRPGWRTASLSGTFAIVFTCLPLDDSPDPEVIQAEMFVAAVVTCLLVLSARLAVQRQKEQQDRREAGQAKSLARQSINLAEMRMRKSAQALEMAGSAMHLSQHQLLNRFDGLLSSHEARRYQRQAAATHSQVTQIIDSLHPIAWRENGLSAALYDTIGRTLREVGIAYRCELKDQELPGMTADVQTAIYRMACESVAHINTQMICSRVRIHLRTGITRKLRWAVLCVDGIVEPARINDAVYDLGERRSLASKLGAHDLDPDMLRDYVRLFDGQLHVRTRARGLRMTCLLVDKPGLDDKQVPPPVLDQLWVT